MAHKYRGGWYMPHIDPGTKLPSGDILSGAFYAASGLKLRKMLIDHPWPEGTIFEISEQASPTVKSRCYRQHLVNWNPRATRLPVDLAIPIPTSRSMALITFSQLLWAAFEYGAEVKLLDHDRSVRLYEQIVAALQRR